MKSRKHAMYPPPWLIEGAMVDYHAIIGGPVTQFNMRARTGPQQLSGPAWVVWLDGKSGCVSVDACTPATGSLGPSNDDSPDVQVEMRAAELEAWIAVDWLHVGGAFDPTERDGWRVWVANGDPNAEVEPGWLAAEIYTAGANERPDAWAWDTSRPLAEQLAETAADALGVELLREIDDEKAAAGDGKADEIDEPDADRSDGAP